MTTGIHDQVQLKKKQRQIWDSAAPGWHKWWTFFKQAQPISDRLIDAAQISPGDRVLDIATGLGEPAITAAHKVGPKGRVIGTDLSSEMITIAQQLAAEQQLENIEFKVADAEALDFPESSFDAVLCRWGVQFFNDLSAALRQIKKALVPGGWFATVVFAEPPKMPLLSLPGRILQEKFDVPLPPPGTPGPLHLAGGAPLEQALRESGFRSVQSERVSSLYTLPVGERYSTLIQDVVAPVAALVYTRPKEQQEAIWSALDDAAKPFSTEDGLIRFPAENVLIVAQK